MFWFNFWMKMVWKLGTLQQVDVSPQNTSHWILITPFPPPTKKHSGSLLLIINYISLEQPEVSNAACWIKQMVWPAGLTTQVQKNPMRCSWKAREQPVTWVGMPSETHRKVFWSQASGGLTFCLLIPNTYGSNKLRNSCCNRSVSYG